MFAFASSVHYPLYVLAREIMQKDLKKKKKKDTQIGNEEIKLSLFVDDKTFVCINPKESTKKKLILIN